MATQQQTGEVDENGIAIPTGLEEIEEAPPEEDTPEPGAEEASEAEAPEAPVKEEPGKYRIGDKTFKTQDEALAYAEASNETESEIDAYRRLVREALTAPGGAPENVTPPPPVITDEEFYANPTETITKAMQRAKQEAHAEIAQNQATTATANAVWAEFTQRHPDLADFRAETEAFVTQNLNEVQKVSKTKGRSAGLDFVALKLKTQFQRYADAAKPKKDLANTSGGPSPTNRVSGVTPKAAPKKELSFAEQLRQNRKVK